MNLSRLFFLGVILICIGCKNESASTNQETKTTIQLDSLSKEKITLDLLKLSPDAKKDLETFEDFQNLKTMMSSLRDANPFYVKKYADTLDVLIQTFEENLSEDLNVNTINSRITILLTESGLLKQISARKNIEPEKVLAANMRLIKAYNSLVIQLNELSLAIPENIEKELLRDLEDEEN